MYLFFAASSIQTPPSLTDFSYVHLHMNMEQVQIYIFNIRVISINYLNIAMPMVSDLQRSCYNHISAFCIQLRGACRFESYLKFWVLTETEQPATRYVSLNGG